MIKQQLHDDLKKAVEDLGFPSSDIVLSIPQNPNFGDYTSNIALQLAKDEPNNSEQNADAIAKRILQKFVKLDYLEKTEIAGPGFINFFIKDDVLIKSVLEKKLKGPFKKEIKKYLVEFAQPNTHKSFHIGHFRNVSLGECLSRLLEFQGHKVFRATYGSDIGLPVAKAIWGVGKLINDFEKVKNDSSREKAEFLGQAYALGAKSYDEDPIIKEEIDLLNKQIYQKSTQIMPIWKETRQWSIDYFDSLYQRLGTKFDREFWESEVERIGKRIVEENIDQVFITSDKAVIFPGEKYGLHNRVFITSAGNPTYEAKELGLAKLEEQAFPYDQSWHVVGSEQNEYFKVLFKVLELIEPELAGKKRHISYGMVNLSTGKMSSRSGEVVTIDGLIDEIKTKVKKVMSANKLETSDKIIEQVAIGAAKFSMLKYSPAATVTFDIDESVALEGDSGPYVQYAYVRSQSVARNAPSTISLANMEDIKLEVEERSVVFRLETFLEIMEQAIMDLRPNLVCQYLLDLAKDFNLFYQKHRILGSDKSGFRLALTQTVGNTLKTGLELLGIEAPGRM